MNCIEADNEMTNKVKIPFEWETLLERTCRAKVIGGWIISDIVYDDDTYQMVSNSLVFIPDPTHAWEV